MQIRSAPSEDTRAPDRRPGGYEWWYFDAISGDGKFSFVVIFYEGNPFSPSYIDALKGRSETDPLPSNFPAMSISVYKNGSPVYYSFTEFAADQCDFSEECPYLTIGSHRMEAKQTKEKLRYKLDLKETLPSGDALQAQLTFTDKANPVDFDAGSGPLSAEHQWNLVQPRADVEGTICIKADKAADRTIAFQGRGYHDHNGGSEPLSNEFDDWYWGRFHFDYGTLIYYIMNKRNRHQHRAWLVDPDSNSIIQQFDDITISDESLSLFGLSSARKLEFHSNGINIQIQQSQKVDNGPFYQRFLSDGFLEVRKGGTLESKKGITEYIRPDRIDSRLFRPLVNMRIRRAGERPHWVQKSGRLYRWTW